MGKLLTLVKHLQPAQKKIEVPLSVDTTPKDSESRSMYWQFYQPPRNFQTMLQAYMVNPWVYSAIYLIANTASTVPFNIYTKQTQRLADKDHYLWKIFEQPNPHMTFTDLLEATFIYMELIGNAFWEIVMNADGFVKNLYLLDPCKMRIVPHPDYYVMAYEYLVGDKKIVYKPWEIVHFKYFNPSNEYWGTGSLQPVWDQIILDGKSTDYNARFFENDATPGGVITSPRPISDSVWNQLVGRWTGRHEGVRKSHKVAVLDDGMKFETISSTPKEASFPELKKIVRDTIFVGLGVPPTLAGVPDVANYSTARVAQSIFYDSTIAPKLRKVADLIDQKVIEPQDPTLMGAFDTSIAPINIVKLSANSRIISRLVQAKLITSDEARALLGLPPLKEEEKPPKEKPRFSPNTPDAMGESESTGEGEEEGDKGDKGLFTRSGR